MQTLKLQLVFFLSLNVLLVIPATIAPLIAKIIKTCIKYNQKKLIIFSIVKAAKFFFK